MFPRSLLTPGKPVSGAESTAVIKVGDLPHFLSGIGMGNFVGMVPQ